MSCQWAKNEQQIVNQIVFLLNVAREKKELQGCEQNEKLTTTSLTKNRTNRTIHQNRGQIEDI